MENSDKNENRPEQRESLGNKLRNILKKKEDNPEGNLEGPPKDPTDLDFQEILEKELGIIKVYDYAINNSLDLVFQPKLMEKYHSELIAPLLGTEENNDFPDKGRMFLREEWGRLEIKTKVSSVIAHAEEVAAANGIKSSSQKVIGRWSVIIMVASMGLYFLLPTIFTEADTTTIMIPTFLVMCMGPQLVKTLIEKRFNKFKLQYMQTILDDEQENIQDVRVFIQDIIDDVRDRLISQKVALEKIQFVLFSESYTNVRFVRNQGGTRGSPLRSIYQFDYPEGMGPAKTQYGKSGIPEDDHNDMFIYLRRSEFDDEGRLATFTTEIPNKDDYKLPEALLNASEFTDVEDPDLVIEGFANFDKIQCECGNNVQLYDMKTSRSALHNDFEFYLMMGKKCSKCGKNPYVLCNSPGNAEIPGGLKKIFE
ncbi:MAG: hypothetical protein ACTSRK_20130 [Promethearchaeota archaeon]